MEVFPFFKCIFEQLSLPLITAAVGAPLGPFLFPSFFLSVLFAVMPVFVFQQRAEVTYETLEVLGDAVPPAFPLTRTQGRSQLRLGVRQSQSPLPHPPPPTGGPSRVSIWKPGVLPRALPSWQALKPSFCLLSTTRLTKLSFSALCAERGVSAPPFARGAWHLES